MAGGNRLRLNIPIAAIGMIAEKAVTLMIIVLLANRYSGGELGAYLLIVSVTNLVALIADIGTNRHLFRICSAEPEKAAGWRCVP